MVHVKFKEFLYANKLIAVPKRQFVIQAGDGLSIKDIVFPGDFVELEITKDRKNLSDITKWIKITLNDLPSHSYSLEKEDTNHATLSFEDKKLAKDAFEKFGFYAKTIEMDQITKTLETLDLDKQKRFTIFIDGYLDVPVDPTRAEGPFICSICEEDFLLSEMIVFDCSHAYCPDCVYWTIVKGIELGYKEFKCLYNGLHCQTINWGHVDLVLSHLSSALSSEDIWSFLSLLIMNKLRLFISNNSSYHFCNGDNCSAIYESIKTLVNEQRCVYLDRYCTSCKSLRCAACGFEPHPEEDCISSRNRIMTTLSEGNINPYVSQILCVNESCRTPIEKMEGCDLVECTQCGWYFCFRCLEFKAETAREVYKHMEKKHGSFGDIEIAVPNPLMDPTLRELYEKKNAALKAVTNVQDRITSYVPEQNGIPIDKNAYPQLTNPNYFVNRLYDPKSDYKNDLLIYHYIMNAMRVQMVPKEQHTKTDKSDRNFWKNFSLDQLK